MSTDADTTVELPFGAAYDRLQEVAAELGADATMAPERLIALLREGKGLERALRDHLERVEQEVRAIEDGDGAVPFRIAGASAPSGPAHATPAPATPVPGPAGPAAAGPDAGSVASPDPAAPATVPPATTPEPAPRPPAPPTLGFGDDDDIPF
ncbi:hypothetical protein [Patulibacter minatonensis]|uniref:hypothetical protein n=1 Tax=Patulibacter minatonensis TaxID=298163 RepID=UPI000479BFDC|nr:hypothetical protein [Patulibacter minatonensis]